MFKHEARIHCESADFIVIMNPEQRIAYRAKVMELAKEAEWKISDDEAPYSHHMLFEVQNPKQLDEDQSTTAQEDSDDFDLSKF